MSHRRIEGTDIRWTKFDDLVVGCAGCGDTIPAGTEFLNGFVVNCFLCQDCVRSAVEALPSAPARITVRTNMETVGPLIFDPKSGEWIEDPRPPEPKTAADVDHAMERLRAEKAKINAACVEVVKRNIGRCRACGYVIESRTVHDFVQCKCGKSFVDGGTDYCRAGGEFEGIEE